MLGLFRKKFSKLAAKGDRCFDRGEFGLAIALGIILLLLAFSVNLVLTIVQQRGRLQ